MPLRLAVSYAARSLFVFDHIDDRFDVVVALITGLAERRHSAYDAWSCVLQPVRQLFDNNVLSVSCRDNSGLFSVIKDLFSAATEIVVRVSDLLLCRERGQDTSRAVNQ